MELALWHTHTHTFMDISMTISTLKSNPKRNSRGYSRDATAPCCRFSFPVSNSTLHDSRRFSLRLTPLGIDPSKPRRICLYLKIVKHVKITVCWDWCERKLLREFFMHGDLNILLEFLLLKTSITLGLEGRNNFCNVFLKSH